MSDEQRYTHVLSHILQEIESQSQQSANQVGTFECRGLMDMEENDHSVYSDVGDEAEENREEMTTSSNLSDVEIEMMRGCDDNNLVISDDDDLNSLRPNVVSRELDMLRIEKSLVRENENPEILGTPPEPIESIESVFKTKYAFNFVIKNWKLKGWSDSFAAEELKSLRGGDYGQKGFHAATLPTDLQSVKRTMLPKLHIQEKIEIPIPASIKFTSPLYSIREHLIRIMTSTIHTDEMHFQYREPQHGMMLEFFETPGFRDIANTAKDDELPIIINLYYDDFLLFRSLPGSAGGLYFTLQNFSRRHISRPRSIFCLGVIKPEDDLMLSYQTIINALLDIREGFHMIMAIRDQNGETVRSPSK